jgi:hypothetical protein
VVGTQIRLWLPEDDARTQSNRENVIAAGEGESGYRLFKEPRAHGAVGRIETMDQKAIDVAPVGSSVGFVPNYALSAAIAGWSHTYGL